MPSGGLLVAAASLAGCGGNLGVSDRKGSPPQVAQGMVAEITVR